MQRRWMEDENKCTFIVLDKAFPSDAGLPDLSAAMAGDVNLFFNDPDDTKTAEIEVRTKDPRSLPFPLLPMVTGDPCSVSAPF